MKKMSSIFQQEQRKPAPKSPIPRSRSDFNYVGLTTKEKRWTTDFSLLLPAFSRDSSGYSRLTETPVTLQPRTKNSNLKLNKSHTVDSGTVCNNQSTESKIHTQNLYNSEKIDQRRDSLPSKNKYPLNSVEQPCCHHVKHEANMKRSPTMDPKVLISSPRKVPNIICRSPTLDPTILTRSPKEANRWPPPADSKECGINRSPLCGCNSSSEVVRSQSLRSLRRPSDKSPSKIRNSESAQSDVTGSTLK